MLSFVLLRRKLKLMAISVGSWPEVPPSATWGINLVSRNLAPEATSGMWGKSVLYQDFPPLAGSPLLVPLLSGSSSVRQLRLNYQIPVLHRKHFGNHTINFINTFCCILPLLKWFHLTHQTFTSPLLQASKCPTFYTFSECTKIPRLLARVTGLNLGNETVVKTLVMKAAKTSQP